MEALVVTFKNYASREQFTAATAEHVPVFAELDGLLAKIWIADPETDTKGAIYLFGDRTAHREIEAILAGPDANFIQSCNLQGVGSPPDAGATLPQSCSSATT